MITTKELKTLEDFKKVQCGDFLAVEWQNDSYILDRKTRFAIYRVIEVHEQDAEIILQKKHNIYFNYELILGLKEGHSNAKHVVLIDFDINPVSDIVNEQEIQNAFRDFIYKDTSWRMFFKDGKYYGLTEERYNVFKAGFEYGLKSRNPT